MLCKQLPEFLAFSCWQILPRQFVVSVYPVRMHDVLVSSETVHAFPTFSFVERGGIAITELKCCRGRTSQQSNAHVLLVSTYQEGETRRVSILDVKYKRLL